MGENSAAPHEVYTALLAHELRTPITSIFAYLQLLSDDRLLNDPDTLRRYLTVVRGRAASLAHLVSELTTFTDLVAEGDLRMVDSGSPSSLGDVVAGLVAGRRVRVEL